MSDNLITIIVAWFAGALVGFVYGFLFGEQHAKKKEQK